MSRLTVSVVLPSIGLPAPRQAVASAVAQTVDLQIPVVDDSGEGIDHASLAEGFEITVVAKSGRIGLAGVLLDDDDMWLLGHLRDVLEHLSAKPAADLYASRGLVPGEHREGGVESAVLLGDHPVPRHFLGWASWLSRSRRLFTPSPGFLAGVDPVPNGASRRKNEHAWWLLIRHRDRGSQVIHSPDSVVVVHQSQKGLSARATSEIAERPVSPTSMESIRVPLLRSWSAFMVVKPPALVRPWPPSMSLGRQRKDRGNGHSCPR